MFVSGAVLAAIPGCRGTSSDQPPIHLNPNMDTQQKYKPQAESGFFADGATMRTQVEHTVARGELYEDDAMYLGKLGDTYVSSPVAFNSDALKRGKERFEIYCRPCHGVLGNGRGKILEYKYPIPPTSYFEPRLLSAMDGYLFEVISNGMRNMPSYKAQIPVHDRWCIVGYVRKLQHAELPDSLKGLQRAVQTVAK